MLARYMYTEYSVYDPWTRGYKDVKLVELHTHWIPFNLVRVQRAVGAECLRR